jgi:hypothetical protein
MSFATVLGGTVTLIGTSTNLVVSGLQQEKYGDTDPSKVFSFFTITPYGERACMYLAGGITMWTCIIRWCWWLLLMFFCWPHCELGASAACQLLVPVAFCVAAAIRS